MWITNNDKERARIYLRSDIESNITDIMDINNHIQSLISAISCATEGTPSGRDREMIDDCQRAIKGFDEALRDLYACRNCVNQIDTKEWVEDGSD